MAVQFGVADILEGEVFELGICLLNGQFTALKAGKDVACEKPLTRNIAEGRLMSDLVAKTRRVFRTDSEFRSNKTMHRAAQLVRNGKI